MLFWCRLVPWDQATARACTACLHALWSRLTLARKGLMQSQATCQVVAVARRCLEFTDAPQKRVAFRLESGNLRACESAKTARREGSFGLVLQSNVGVLQVPVDALPAREKC